MKEDLIAKMEETSKNTDDKFGELIKKNEEQDNRMATIETINTDLQKRIEVLEKQSKDTYTDKAARLNIPDEAGTSGTNGDSRKAKENTQSTDNNEMREIINMAKLIVGLQPIDQEDIQRNTKEGQLVTTF